MRCCSGHEGEAFVPQQVQTGIHDSFVIACTAAAFQFGDDLIHCSCRTVGAVREHGFGHVGDGHDPRFRQYLVTYEALRISGSVHSFVMLKNNGGYRPREPDVLESFVAGLRMLLDQQIFVLIQFAGAAHDFSGNVDLADIVDQGSEFEAADSVFTQAHFAGDRNGQMADPLLVTRSIRVAHFNGAGDDSDEILQGLLLGNHLASILIGDAVAFGARAQRFDTEREVFCQVFQ